MSKMKELWLKRKEDDYKASLNELEFEVYRSKVKNEEVLNNQQKEVRCKTNHKNQLA